MSTPDMPQHDGILAQVLMSQGKIETQLAVIDTKLGMLPDHEARLREGERERQSILSKLDTIAAERAMSRDWWARGVAGVAVVAAIAASVADYVHR